MKLHNTLSKKVEDFSPIEKDRVTVYSCGPTVYDHIHIGNLSAFIAADTLHRTLVAAGYKVKHVMNFTDVDDKTIRRSQERYPDDAPETALKKLTEEYERIFLNDMRAIGNDIDMLTFVKATESIDGMRRLITKLYGAGFAYIADDGIYFSIEKYRAGGKKYGQLLELTAKSTSEARIRNDEYDKESLHDFALWKTQKGNEPAWELELDGHNLLGRPGWHLECSVMSADNLGQPFDIHTGGVDLIFPHHENEIAQSTAAANNAMYAQFFVHNEHLLVEGRKMSKSLNNFYTLRDIRERGFDPSAFRLLVLQSHYRKQSNFSWDNLDAAEQRLKALRAMADLRWQTSKGNMSAINSEEWLKKVYDALNDDLNTPQVLAVLSMVETQLQDTLVPSSDKDAFESFLASIDLVLGLRLLGGPDITPAQKEIIKSREKARAAKEWSRSDELRAKLHAEGIEVRDTPQGPVWSRA